MSKNTKQNTDVIIKICKDFIEEQKIYCSETIYQTDWVIENAYEFIEKICEAVGYFEDEE